MGEGQDVQTEADELIRVLSTVPEMSLPDLAKRMHISETTLESIATFLEEEGVVGIQYKFTTPYLSLTDKATPQLAPPTPLSAKNETLELTKDFSIADLEKQVDWLADSWASLQEGELIQKTTLFLNQLSKLASITITTDGPLSHSMQVRNELSAALRVNEEIRKHLQMGERSVAQDLFGDLIFRLRQLLKKTHSLGLMAQYAPLLPENSVQVIGKVRELMEQKRYDEAESLYGLLRDKATEFPKTFYKKELQFDTDLSQLNQDLFSASEKFKSERFTIMSAQMKKIMDEITALLKKKELSVAENHMRHLKLMLSELPEIHPGQKADIESRVMRLSGELLALKGTFHSQTFTQKFDIIRKLITKMDQHIAQSQMEQAGDTYNEMKSTFGALPDSFPERKITMQQDILHAYERLTESYKRYNEAQFAMMEKDLLTTLAEMAVQVKLRQYERASELYHRIKLIFYNLPAGHLQRKVELQQDILSVFDVFKKNYPQAMLEQFMRYSSEIKTDLEEGHRLVQTGDLVSAWNKYYRMLELFKRLPVIGPEQRKEIRMHVLGFYRSLLQASDAQHMKHLDGNQNEAYQRLLSLIMKFHDLVHERAFEQLRPTFTLMTQLFHELPMKIVNTEIRLKREIALLGQEVQLAEQLKDLEMQRARGENQKANLNSEVVRKNMVLLRSLNPTDDELFRYADEKTSTITTSFEHMAGMRGKPKELPALDTTMNTLSNVAAQPTEVKTAQKNPAGMPIPPAPATTPASAKGAAAVKTQDVTEKINSLKKLAYPAVRIPT